MKVKMILETEYGCIGVYTYGYVVCDRVDLGKKGETKLIRPRYFSLLKNAIEELREVFLAKKLTEKGPAKTLLELMERIERINNEWKKFYDKYGMGMEMKQ